MAIKDIKFRKLSEFLDFEQFRLPVAESDTKFAKRIRTNILYFQGNYIAALFLIFIYVCISQPPFVFPLLLSLSSLTYILGFVSSPVIVGELTLGRLHLLGIWLGFFLLFGWIFGGVSFIVGLCIALLFIILHASLRRPSLKAKASTFFTSVPSIDDDMQEDPESGRNYQAPPPPMYANNYRSEVANKYRRRM